MNAKLRTTTLLIGISVLLFGLRACTYEYEIPVAPGVFVGLANSHGSGVAGYCVERGDPNHSVLLEVCGVTRFGVANGVVYGTTSSGWFITGKELPQEYKTESEWRDDLSKLGISQPVLRDPPTRIEGILSTAVGRLELACAATVSLAVLAFFTWRLTKRRAANTQQLAK